MRAHPQFIHNSQSLDRTDPYHDAIGVTMCCQTSLSMSRDAGVLLNVQ